MIILIRPLIPKLSDFLSDLYRPHAHQGLQGSAKTLDISIPMSFRGGFRKPLCNKILAHFLAKNRSAWV